MAHASVPQGKRKKMKKMIVFAATLMVAIMSQAITVQWGCASAAYFGTTRLNNSTYVGTGYVIALAGPSVSQGTIDALYNQWKNGSPVVSVNNTGQTSTNLGALGPVNAVIADGATIPNSSLLLTENVTYFTSIFFISVGGQDYYAMGPSVLYDTTSAKWNATTQTLDVRGSLPSGTTWTAIPEPTAMALLALGAAAFGLRRRFRK